MLSVIIVQNYKIILFHTIIINVNTCSIFIMKHAITNRYNAQDNNNYQSNLSIQFSLQW